MKKKSKWKQIAIKAELYRKLWSSKGSLSISDYIEKLLTQAQKPDRIGITHDKDLEEDYPCPARFKLGNFYYCAQKAPLIHKLLSLQVCKAHFEYKHFKPETLTKKHIYVTCNAKQTMDKRKGLMLWCPITGEWQTPQVCKNRRCLELKILRSE